MRLTPAQRRVLRDMARGAELRYYPHGPKVAAGELFQNFGAGYLRGGTRHLGTVRRATVNVLVRNGLIVRASPPRAYPRIYELTVAGFEAA